ncbi:MAG: septum site-determining protein MinC [Acaryochloris sp. RU_4_1]|nr:septum site-determining protein MinC [Acaryochloris sp. SU_5_25]NJM64731.1 septum site-determining protein MinC [Acaryochloris sp. RU_4_1]NJR53950.1 septum site-determining protein MinC [Acaryochloris sp. CRU_2_0]
MDPDRLKMALASTSATAEGEIESPRVAEVQIHLKTEDGKLFLYLPTAHETLLDWPDLLQELQKQLDAGQRFWPPNTHVDLVTGDRLLDHRQLQMIVNALSTVKLHLTRLHTQRRQTAVAAATSGYSVEQQSQILPMAQSTIAQFALDAEQKEAEPLYIQTTLRSGAEVRHPGSVIIIGDLNPGSSVVADGDIVVWGRLRGVAHAGASGNDKSRIMALQMEPTQLRIGEWVARAPEADPDQFYPEVAYVAAGGIQIARASDFSKNVIQS